MVLRILEARISRKLFRWPLLCTTLSTSQLNKVKSFGSCSQVNTETYSEPSQASKIELLQEYGSSHSFNRCSRKYAKSRKNTCDGDCALAQVLFENLAEIYLYILYSPLDIYLFKVNNGNFRTSHEVSLTLTVKTPELRQWHGRHWRHFDVFWFGSLSCVYIVNFELFLSNFYFILWQWKCLKNVLFII